MSSKLFEPLKLGSLTLPNRIIMAPLTRARAENPELVPNELMAEYYRQRATAGLILTEGTWPNAEGIGFTHVPGLFTQAQAEGWKKITKAVHDADGRIFSQLGHLGPQSHPDYLNGQLPFSASAINPQDKVFTPKGFQDAVTPRAMSIADIKRTVEDYRVAAQNAKNAGFDGVEIHAAHVYLLPSFLNSSVNKRTDPYGGTSENRARIVLEILDAVIGVWGPDKVGIKLHPGARSGAFVPNSDTEETYQYLLERLNSYKLAYVHLLGNVNSTDTTQSLALRRPWAHFRSVYKGVIFAAGGFTQKTGEEALKNKEADAIVYGTLYIANPDLVERFRVGAEFNAPNQDYFYTGGPRGYTDYKFLTQ